MQDFNHVFKQVHKDAKTSHLKPLYMLIKVDVDADIVRTERDSEIYAQNHCNKLEYELVECYYPEDEQYPYIAK